MASGDTRSQKHPVGIDPAALSEVERLVPMTPATILGALGRIPVRSSRT